MKFINRAIMVLTVLALLTVCLALGFSGGVLYQISMQREQAFYTYRKTCLTVYKGGVMPYPCEDNFNETKTKGERK